MRALSVAAALTGLHPLAGAHAAEQHRPACLNREETRQMLEARKAVPPMHAVESALRGTPGEQVGLRLCRNDAALFYDVIVLRRDGRLVHVAVDAAGGGLLPAHGQP